MRTRPFLMPARFRLREILEGAGISQSEFAKASDLSFATVHRLCQNTTGQVSLETIDKALSALVAAGHKVTVADLIEWKKRGRAA